MRREMRDKDQLRVPGVLCVPAMDLMVFMENLGGSDICIFLFIFQFV